MAASSLTADHIHDFGALLRYLRRRARLTQRDLAIATGYSESQICRLEQNTRTADLSALMALFVPALGIDDQPDLIARLIDLATLAREQDEGVTVVSTTRTATSSQVSVGSQPASLPMPAVRLVGRERDLAGVCAELARPEVRLLTITGAPGIGKTALGLQAGAALAEGFAAGVAMVDLAAVTEAGLVVATIAQALRLRDHGQEDLLDTLKAHVRDQELLLVVDNCEHLLEAAPAIADLLAAAPRLKILATSRAPLRVSFEHEWPLLPLELPGEADQTPERLAGVPAVALFLARARAAAPAFALNAANSAAIAAICRQLDGVPLALELAAAWSKVLTPQEIAGRLGSPFAFLTRRPQDWPARHQTLWEAIGWSDDLLGRAERQLLQRLSVFPAAFSIEAAYAVGHSEGDDQLTVLARLASLVDQSLVWRSSTAEGATLFGLLDIIRAYADHQLRAQDDQRRFAQRHADHYCQLAETAEKALMGEEQAQWLARLDGVYPHLRAALRWGIDQGAPELAARIAGALWRFWHLRGYYAEGSMWLGEVVRQGGRLPDAALAKVLNCLGQVLIEQARYDEARLRFEQGLELQRRLGNPLGVARTLNNLGMIAENQGDFAAARRLHEESLSLKRTLGDPLATANSLNNLGIVLEAQGAYDEARDMLEEGLALRRAHGDHWSIAVSLLNLAQVAYRQGRHREALPLLRESVELRQSLADTTGIAWSLEGIANVASALHAWPAAVRLWGAAAALRSALGSPLPPSQRALYDQNVALARVRLSAQDFNAAWHAHAGRPQEDLIQEALTCCDQLGAEGSG